MEYDFSVSQLQETVRARHVEIQDHIDQARTHLAKAAYLNSLNLQDVDRASSARALRAAAAAGGSEGSELNAQGLHGKVIRLQREA
jgi:hypothetical protein